MDSSKGEDAVIVNLGSSGVMVVHADPTMDAVEHVRWHAVHISYNDVA